MATLQVSCVFLCCHGRASGNVVLFFTWENNFRNTQNAWNNLWLWSIVSYVYLWTVQNKVTIRMWRPLTWSDLERFQKFEMLARNFWMTLKFMECQLCLNQKTVNQILSYSLGRSKFCPEFILHSLRDEQNEPMVTDCEDFIQTTCRTSSVITVDISRVFKYNYKIKYPRMEWRTEASPRPKCFCLCRSWSKWWSLLLITGCIP